jgi:hypothetical protein
MATIPPDDRDVSSEHTRQQMTECCPVVDVEHPWTRPGSVDLGIRNSTGERLESCFGNLSSEALFHLLQISDLMSEITADNWRGPWNASLVPQLSLAGSGAG